MCLQNWPNYVFLVPRPRQLRAIRPLLCSIREQAAWHWHNRGSSYNWRRKKATLPMKSLGTTFPTTRTGKLHQPERRKSLKNFRIFKGNNSGFLFFSVTETFKTPTFHLVSFLVLSLVSCLVDKYTKQLIGLSIEFNLVPRSLVDEAEENSRKFVFLDWLLHLTSVQSPLWKFTRFSAANFLQTQVLTWRFPRLVKKKSR